MCKLGINQNKEDHIQLGVAFFTKYPVYFDVHSNKVYIKKGEELSFWNFVDIPLLVTDIVLGSGLVAIILFFGIRRIQTYQKLKREPNLPEDSPEKAVPDGTSGTIVSTWD